MKHIQTSEQFNEDMKDNFMSDTPKGKNPRTISRRIGNFFKDRKGDDRWEDEKVSTFQQRLDDIKDLSDDWKSVKLPTQDKYVKKDNFGNTASDYDLEQDDDGYNKTAPRKKRTKKLSRLMDDSSPASKDPWETDDIYTCPECNGEFGATCDICDGDGIVDKETYDDFNG